MNKHKYSAGHHTIFFCIVLKGSRVAISVTENGTSFVWMKRSTELKNKLDLVKWTARVLDKCNQRTRTLNSMCKFRWFLYFPLYVISDAQSAKVVFNANVRLSRLMNRNWWYDVAHLRRQRHFPSLPKAWLCWLPSLFNDTNNNRSAEQMCYSFDNYDIYSRKLMSFTWYRYWQSLLSEGRRGWVRMEKHGSTRPKTKYFLWLQIIARNGISLFLVLKYNIFYSFMILVKTLILKYRLNLCS